MSEFTKGPWVSYPPHSEKDFLNSAIVNIESEYGCHVCSTTIYKRTFKEIKANAHLIAAAPEMYEALEEALSMIERQPDFNDDGDGLLISRCKQALVKARGEL